MRMEPKETNSMQPRLTRSRTDRMIAGVCGGLGYYFGVDPVIVRLIFVVLAFTTFITPIIYPILWLIMPEEGTLQPPSTGLPTDARFDPLTGQPLPPRQPPVTGQTVNLHGHPGVPQQPQPSSSGRNRTLGLLLAGFGAIVLLNNLGDVVSELFGYDLSNFVVPVLLVGVGMYLLRKKSA